MAPLPGILESEAGLSIASSVQWEEIRRQEILDLFRDHVYGRVPEEDVKVDYRVLREDREALDGKAVEKEVVMEVSKGDRTMEINMLIFLPERAAWPGTAFRGT